MKRVFHLLFLGLFLVACGAKPAPEWIATGHKQLETFKQDFLSGRDAAITEAHFQRAVDELKKGGDADLLGKLWLTRMALQVAVREVPEGEEEYRKTETVELVPANRNYDLFLNGEASQVDGSLLPESYRPFWSALLRGDSAETSAAVAAIENPVSRLVAAGVALRHRQETESILKTAVETASREGWKRALFAWLAGLRSYYEASGEAQKAALVGARIQIMK